MYTTTVLHTMTCYYVCTKLAAPRSYFFWPAFVARILTSRPRKSVYGLFLGCRSALDSGREKKPFTSLPPQESLFWPAFVARKMTPRSRKSGYGLLLGCVVVRRSEIDGGPFEKLFLTMFEKRIGQKPGNSSPSTFWSAIAIDRAWSTYSGGSP